MISTTSHPRQIDLSFWATESSEFCRLKMMEIMLKYDSKSITKAMEKIKPDLHRFWKEDLAATRQSAYLAIVLVVGFVVVFILTLTLDRPLLTWAISLGILFPMFFAAIWINGFAQKKIRKRYSFVVEI